MHVDQLWFSAPGGIGTYIWELRQALPAADPSLDLVGFHARWRRPPARTMLFAGRGPDVEIPLPIRALYPAWSLLGRPGLPRSLAHADVVHATNHAAIPPVRTGQRLVVTVHDLAFERFPWLFPRAWLELYRRGLRRAASADAVVVPSSSVADELAAHPGFDPARVHVIPLASAMRTSQPGTRSNERDELADWGVNPPYVLTVGTVEPRKNLGRLVRAYRHLAAEGFPQSLVILGPDGSGADELERELAVPGAGRIVRAQPSEEALALAYLEADAFAYVSLWEGFGLPVLEAMSMGAPTVTSRVSAMPEVAGDAALLVDPTDEGAIANALRCVLTDEALAADLRRRGRERSAQFSWEATARATLDVYRSVTSGRT